MVDKSSLVIILLSTLFIMLTFRDLVRETTTLSPDEDVHNHDGHEHDSEHDDFHANKFDDEFSDKDARNEDLTAGTDSDSYDQVKTIPSLKIMKTLNQQTLKFMFWYILDVTHILPFYFLINLLLFFMRFGLNFKAIHVAIEICTSSIRSSYKLAFPT